MEMIKFVDTFFPGSKLSTFFESCGVADLITTCYGGRNRKVSEAFVKTGKVFIIQASLNFFTVWILSNFFLFQSIVDLEAEMLNGQKLQGPITAEEVNVMLKAKNMEDKYVVQGWWRIFTSTVKTIPNLWFSPFRFPLFTAVHRICTGQIKPAQLIDSLKNHPEHMWVPSFNNYSPHV